MDKSHNKHLEHMQRRKRQGLTFRELESDFGVSKSKIHRDLLPEDAKKIVQEIDDILS